MNLSSALENHQASGYLKQPLSQNITICNNEASLTSDWMISNYALLEQSMSRADIIS